VDDVKNRAIEAARDFERRLKGWCVDLAYLDEVAACA